MDDEQARHVASQELELNKAAVRRFVAAMPASSATIDEIRATMAEDGIWRFELFGTYGAQLKAFTAPTRWSREEMIQMHLEFLRHLKTPYPIQIVSMVAEGDRVVTEAIGRGVSAFTSLPYEQHYSFHFRLKDGLIVEGVVYQDTLHLWETWMHSAPRDFFLDI